MRLEMAGMRGCAVVLVSFSFEVVLRLAVFFWGGCGVFLRGLCLGFIDATNDTTDIYDCYLLGSFVFVGASAHRC